MRNTKERGLLCSNKFIYRHVTELNPFQAIAANVKIELADKGTLLKHYQFENSWTQSFQISTASSFDKKKKKLHKIYTVR